MRLLLDSHSLLWAIGNPKKLSEKARNAIGDSNNRLFTSMATLWELSIKVNIGKLRVPDQFFDNLETAGYEILPIKQRHLYEYRKLPIENHRDPFDRLLVAQAVVEQFTLVTRDQDILEYDIQILSA